MADTESVKRVGEETANRFESKPKDAETIASEAASDTKDLIDDKAAKVSEKAASLFETKPKDAGTIASEAASDTKALLEGKAAKFNDAGNNFLDKITEKFEQARKATIEAIS